MQGVIHNYRRSKRRTSGNQMIVQVDGVSTKDEAAKLIGKKVSFSTGKKTIAGEVKSAHGNSGALKVQFETGMPGQAIGQKVEIQ